MKLWTRANTLWLIATILILISLKLNQPLQTILLILAGCVGGAATHQRLRYEMPVPGQETIVDKLSGAAMVFFIVMVLILFSSIPFFVLMFSNNSFTPSLFMIIMFCFAAIGALLQFFYGTGKNTSGGLSKSFIITVVLLLSLMAFYSIPFILRYI